VRRPDEVVVVFEEVVEMSLDRFGAIGRVRIKRGLKVRKRVDPFLAVVLDGLVERRGKHLLHVDSVYCGECFECRQSSVDLLSERIDLVGGCGSERLVVGGPLAGVGCANVASWSSKTAICSRPLSHRS